MKTQLGAPLRFRERWSILMGRIGRHHGGDRGGPRNNSYQGGSPDNVPPGRHLSLPRCQENGTISLRPMKEFVEKLSANHPLRIVLMSEPDEIGRSEYLVKLTVWLRLLPNDWH